MTEGLTMKVAMRLRYNDHGNSFRLLISWMQLMYKMLTTITEHMYRLGRNEVHSVF